MERVTPHYVRTPEDFYTVVGLPEGRGARESKVLEFKESLNQNPKNDQEIVRDITQFANSDGGVLLLGVRERGQGELQEAEEIVGVRDAERDIEWIRKKLLNYCNDRTFVSEVEMRPLEVKSGQGPATIIVINVRPRPRLIYLWSNDRAIECFMRTDERKVPMRLEDIEARLMDTTRIKRLRMEQLIASHGRNVWFLHGRQHDQQPHEKLVGLTWQPQPGSEHEAIFTGSYTRRDEEGRGHPGTLRAFHLPFAFIIEIWTDALRRVHLLHDGWLEIDQEKGECNWLPSRPHSYRQAEEASAALDDALREERDWSKSKLSRKQNR